MPAPPSHPASILAVPGAQLGSLSQRVIVSGLGSWGAVLRDGEAELGSGEGAAPSLASGTQEWEIRWGWVVPAGRGTGCLCGVEMGVLGHRPTGRPHLSALLPCQRACPAAVSLHSPSHSALDIPKRKQGGNAWGREGAGKEQEGAEMERRGLVGYPAISQGSLGTEAPACFLPVCAGWLRVCVTRESLCRHMCVHVCTGYRYSRGRQLAVEILPNALVSSRQRLRGYRHACFKGLYPQACPLPGHL